MLFTDEELLKEGWIRNIERESDLHPIVLEKDKYLLVSTEGQKDWWFQNSLTDTFTCGARVKCIRDVNRYVSMLEKDIDLSATDLNNLWKSGWYPRSIGFHWTRDFDAVGIRSDIEQVERDAWNLSVYKMEDKLFYKDNNNEAVYFPTCIFWARGMKSLDRLRLMIFTVIIGESEIIEI